MRLLFAGTPSISETILQSLLDLPGCEVVGVFTQPDRASGRGLTLQESPVKVLAKSRGLPVYQPRTLKSPDVQAQITALQADLMIVVAYGLILPKPVLDAPRLGCWNVHVSLLPRWRGAAPIQRAIEAGDADTGVTLMQMDEGLDTGGILLQKVLKILPEDTSKTLHDRLATLGAETVQEALNGRSQLQVQAQSSEGVTYATKLSKEEARLDWHQPALQLWNKVRAFQPWPVAEMVLDDTVIRIWGAEVLEAKTDKAPGSVVGVSKLGLDVATRAGVLRLTRLQLPNKAVREFSDLVNGYGNLFKLGAILHS